jgi:hypothetical protein
VSAGQEFTVDVVINTQPEVRGAQGALSFDPALFEVTDVTEGTFLSDWASANGVQTLVFPEPDIDNAAGHVSDIGVAIIGTVQGGPSGSGVLWTYHMKAKNGASGTSTLTLSNVHVSDTGEGNPNGPQELLGVVVNNGQAVVGG